MNEINISELEYRKRYMKRYKKNLAQIRRLERRLSLIDARLCTIKTSTLSDMPKGGESDREARMAELIDDKKELENRIDKLKGRGTLFRKEITEKIDELDDARYAEVLESFFIDCKDLETIAEDMGFSERHTKRLYSEAIMSMSFE